MTLLRQKAEEGGGTFRLRAGLLVSGRRYTLVNLFQEKPEPVVADAAALEKGLAVSFGAHELKVLRLTAE